MPVSERKKKCRKAAFVWNWLGAWSMGPKPPAFVVIKASRTRDMTRRNGAAKLCRKRMESTPRQTTAMFRSQKPMKQAQSTQGMAVVEGQRTLTMAAMDSPPIQLWMPNQPQATMARSVAGMLAPRTPKLARTKTGNGMPYFAPAWAFRIIGISTMRLPSSTVPMAWSQFMPPAMSELASM